jgi:hypothetical protein
VTDEPLVAEPVEAPSAQVDEAPALTFEPIESPFSAGAPSAPGSPPAHVPPPSAASTPKPESIRAAGLAVADAGSEAAEVEPAVVDAAPAVIVSIESLAPTVVDIGALAPDAVDIAALAPDAPDAETKPARETSDDFSHWLQRLQ